MSELVACDPPPRGELVRLLRARAAELWPALRPLADDVLGADATIDWVALEPGGGAVLVLVGEAGRDLELVARGLAQRAWLLPRLRDWVQLAPRVGLRPEAGARAILLCPAFRPEAAVAAAGAGPGALSLATYRCLRSRAGLEVLVEALSPRAVSRPLRRRPPARSRPSRWSPSGPASATSRSA